MELSKDGITRIFITHILPDKQLKKFKVSPAATNFSLNLINGGGFYKVYSIAGTNVSGALEREETNNLPYEMIYRERLRKKGGLCVKIAALLEQWDAFKKIPRNSSVWFYNMTEISSFLFFMLLLFKPSVLRNIIVLDYTPASSILSKNGVLLRLANKADAIIKLSNSKLFSCTNYAILPGVTPKYQNNPKVEIVNKEFLLSGVLSDAIAQPSLVLDVFSQLSDCKLHITGLIMDKEEERRIKEYSEKYPNIIYHGKVNYDEYLDILHSVTFVLSTRNNAFPENQCNFPSKIIESLLHNRAVISTIAYDQIREVNYFKVSSNKEVMKCQIKNIVEKKENEIVSYINQGNMVAALFNTDVWNSTMERLERIASK